MNTEKDLVPLSWIVPVKKTVTVRNGFLKLKGTPKPVVNTYSEILFRKNDLLNYFDVPEDNKECYGLYQFSNKFGVSVAHLTEMMSIEGMRHFSFYGKPVKGSNHIIFKKHFDDVFSKFSIEYGTQKIRIPLIGFLNKITNDDFVRKFGLAEKDIVIFRERLEGSSFQKIADQFNMTNTGCIHRYYKILNIITNKVNDFIQYSNKKHEIELLKNEVKYLEAKIAKLEAIPVENRKKDFTRIDQTDLSVRSKNALNRIGLVYIQDIVDFGTINLFKVRDLGLRSVREIEVLLNGTIPPAPESETEPT